MRLPCLPPVLAIAALALSACGLGTTGEQGLAGTWVLAEARSTEGPIELPSEAQVTLEFQDGQVTGTAACNHYFGEVHIDGDRVEIGDVGRTLMGCAEPLMSVESAYLSALEDVTSLDRDGDTLALSGEGIELVFDLRAPVPDADLTGTIWQLDTLIDGDTASTPVAEGTLVLHDDGTFVAHTGCRELTGSWEGDDGRLRTFDVFHPDLDCVDEGVPQQDDHVKAVLLADAFVAEVDGAQLTLRADGLGLRFTADDAGGV